MKQVDLNCDLGENFGNYHYGDDEQLMQYISSANIACGFHAGDPHIMEASVAAAIKHQVAIGAHPGFPDLQGFGRRNMSLSASEIYQLVIYQVGALHAFTKVAGTSLHHVKPHGALYNMAAADPEMADAIASAIADFDSSLILYGLAGSALIHAGKAKGLRTAAEVFADRTYTADGMLTPRSYGNALVMTPQEAAKQALTMITAGKVKSVDNTMVSVEAETICIHGDRPGAIEFASAIVDALKLAGINIKPPARME